jgi:hypothetical protein
VDNGSRAWAAGIPVLFSESATRVGVLSPSRVGKVGGADDGATASGGGGSGGGSGGSSGGIVVMVVVAVLVVRLVQKALRG